MYNDNRRHKEICPEMVELLKKVDIKNYTIWNCGEELFGYYEYENGIEFAAKTQRCGKISDENSTKGEKAPLDQSRDFCSNTKAE